MTEKAKRCLAFVLEREGGYIHHPSDPGGETNFGISKRSYPDLDIASLTRADAEAIYHRDYWEKVHGDAFPEPVSLALMDFAVHSGVRTAWHYLMGLLGLPRDASVDQAAEEIRSAPDPHLVGVTLVVERAIFLVRRALTAPGQIIFLKGWMARMIALKQAVEAASGE